MDTVGSRAVQEARSWIGTPYIHQASCKGSGTDCLGLIRGVWRCLYGTEPEQVPAYTADWSEASGTETLFRAALRHMRRKPVVDLQPGDVILFRMRQTGIAKHLGISSLHNGAPHFIHAFSGHAVTESALTLPWAKRIAAVFALPDRSL